MQCWYYNCLRWNEEHETKMKCPVARYHPAVRHTWLPWRTNPRTRVSPEKLHTNGIPSRYKAGNFALSKTSWFADTCFIVYFDSCSVTSTPKLSYLHTIPNSQNLEKAKKKQKKKKSHVFKALRIFPSVNKRAVRRRLWKNAAGR
jgi:hypothetical protein